MRRTEAMITEVEGYVLTYSEDEKKGICSYR